MTMLSMLSMSENESYTRTRAIRSLQFDGVSVEFSLIYISIRILTTTFLFHLLTSWSHPCPTHPNLSSLILTSICDSHFHHPSHSHILTTSLSSSLSPFSFSHQHPLSYLLAIICLSQKEKGKGGPATVCCRSVGSSQRRLDDDDNIDWWLMIMIMMIWWSWINLEMGGGTEGGREEGGREGAMRGIDLQTDIEVDTLSLTHVRHQTVTESVRSALRNAFGKSG